MDIFLKCIDCGGVYETASKTRRRIVYKCNKCGRELSIKKKPKPQKPTKD